MNETKPLGRGLSSLIPRKNMPSPAATTPVPAVPAPRAEPPATLPVAPLPMPPKASAPMVQETKLPADSKRIFDIPIASITPNPHQPRHHIQNESIDDLVGSIRQHGIIQPLIVTKEGDHFQLIAGERRFRAAERIGLPTVPAIVRASRELEQLEIAIVENVQREDLNPIEEALAYQQLSDEFGLTQEEISQKVGKRRTTIANAMRILSLPPAMQQAIRDGRLTASHAKVLLTAVTPEERQTLFDQIVNQGLPVRAAAQIGRATTVRRHTRRSIDPELRATEDELRGRFGTKVRISKRDHRGSIAIEFYSDEEFDVLVNRLRSHQ